MLQVLWRVEGREKKQLAITRHRRTPEEVDFILLESYVFPKPPILEDITPDKEEGIHPLGRERRPINIIIKINTAVIAK